MKTLIKNKLALILIALGLILIAVFKQGFYSKNSESVAIDPQIASAKIVSTIPSPLDETTVLPTQAISINFNLPLENLPELKYAIEPPIEVKAELSDDKKTVKFTPIKNFELGQGYSLHIKSETKFEGKKTLGPEEKVFHFTTIAYSGV